MKHISNEESLGDTTKDFLSKDFLLMLRIFAVVVVVAILIMFGSLLVLIINAQSSDDIYSSKSHFCHEKGFEDVGDYSESKQLLQCVTCFAGECEEGIFKVEVTWKGVEEIK